MDIVMLVLLIITAAVGILTGFAMSAVGVKNLRKKDHSSTDVLVLILGIIIIAASVAGLIFLIALHSEIMSEINPDPIMKV